MSLVVNGISTHQDVDKTWMICGGGVKMGPFGVLDVVGFEVARNIQRLLAEADPNNAQYPKNLQYLEEHFLDKGLTGALGGQGFYNYPNPEYSEPDFLR